MSRTVKGSKGPGYDFWSRRAGNTGCSGYGPVAKHVTHRKERGQSKRIVREQSQANQ